MSNIIKLPNSKSAKVDANKTYQVSGSTLNLLLEIEEQMKKRQALHQNHADFYVASADLLNEFVERVKNNGS